MSSPPTAYEWLREQLEQVSRPDREEDRRTLWVVDRLLGIAVTSSGTIEILLVGDKLRPASGVIRRHLEHARWNIPEAGIQVEANRIALPAQPHFLSLAALVAVELIRFGFDSTTALPTAFQQVEGLVELALRRTALAEEHIIGLMGELLCLEAMLDAIDAPELMSSVLDMWRGYTRERDFAIGGIGIEVKTTQSMSSSHKFSGLHQVEPGAGVDSHEQRVYLLSVGLVIGGNDGQSLAELVERIVQRLGGRAQGASSSLAPLQRRFLSEVASYGQPNSLGYDHETLRQQGIYTVRFKTNFTPRLYDLSDPNIRILRRAFLQTTHVLADDIQFRLELEEVITPSNPEANWAQAIAHMVRTALCS